jgi:hypothetical protein
MLDFVEEPFDQISAATWWRYRRYLAFAPY